MVLHTAYMTQNDCYKSGRTITPKGIMLHSTATPGVMAAQWFSRWNKPGVEKCVHAFVDDKEAWQYLPWNMRGWHAGGSANNTHIGIEMCEPGGYTYSGSSMVGYDAPHNAAYFEAAYNNAVELCAELCRKFGLKASDIICHSEGYKLGIASNHSDVTHWFPKHNKTMDDFRAAVAVKLEGNAKAYRTHIPYGEIEKIYLYDNKSKKTLPAARLLEKADYAVNAWLFNPDWTPCCSGLTLNGKQLSVGYYPGYSMRGGDIIYSEYNGVGWPDYIGGFPLLLKDKAPEKWGDISGVGGDRGRSAIGLTGDGVVLLCCEDADGTADYTLEELQSKLLSYGCVNAINMDGGGSAQCDFGDADIASGRLVPGMLMIKLKSRATLYKGLKNAEVSKLQGWLNAHGYGLALDGSFGPLTDAAVRAFQKSGGLAVDGRVGPATRRALFVFKVQGR